MSSTKKKLVTYLKELFAKDVDRDPVFFTTGDGILYKIYFVKEQKGYLSNTRYFNLKDLSEKELKILTKYWDPYFNPSKYPGEFAMIEETIEEIAKYLSNKLNGEPLKWKTYNYNIFSHAIHEGFRLKLEQQKRQQRQLKEQEQKMKQKKKREYQLYLKRNDIPTEQDLKKFQTIYKKFQQAGKMQQNEQKWHTLNEIDELINQMTCPNRPVKHWRKYITSLLQAYLESGSQGRDFIGQMLADILNKCRLESPEKFTVMKGLIETVLKFDFKSKSDAIFSDPTLERQLRQSLVNQVYSLFE